jgi:hypothetical protein
VTETMISGQWPGPGEMSPDEALEYAYDDWRGTRRDDDHVEKCVIDLDGPTGQEGEPGGARRTLRELRRMLREAQERVGKSDEDRMRWLLRFASLRMEQLEDFQFEDFQCEILAFALPPAARFVPCDVHAMTGELTNTGGHAWVRSGLDRLKDSIVEGRSFEWSVDAHRSHHFTWLDGRLVDRPSVDELDLTEDRFKAQVCSVLISQGHRVRLCQNCDRFFVGHKRQTYCTAKCSNIKRTKRYRERHPERIPEQRRKAHVRKQQRLHGDKVNVRKNVRRRPRGAKP